VVDKPELCTFIVPSVVERGPIKVAVSTGGLSPALSRRLRVILSKAVGDEHVTLAKVLGALRPLVRAMPGTYEDHKRIFEVLIDSELIDAIRSHDRALAEEILYKALGRRIDLREIIK